VTWLSRVDLPWGTIELLSHQLGMAATGPNVPARVREDADILMAYCPERILPGA
jgi:UDP-N-acetyl-D-mannosaminuronate dehydrogenase